MPAVIERPEVRPAPARSSTPAAVARARQPRHDLYALMHKGVRLAMTDTLIRIGRLDTDDDGEVRGAMMAVRELVDLCRQHLAHEASFVHPALEAARPGAAARSASEHDDHLRACVRLEASVRAVERTHGERSAAAARRLYRELALFVAEHLVHMHAEEVENNAVLWSALDDATLIAIERRILASIAPEMLALVLRWMAPAITPAERARFFATLRAKLKPPAFAAVMSDVIGELDRTAKRKLLLALGV